MERDSFVFYRSFYEVARDLSDEDKLKFYDRIINYAIDGIDEKTDGIAETLFILVRPQLDANNKKAVNGATGGRPKKTTGYSKKKPLVIKEENQRLKKNKPNDNVNVNVNANYNDNNNVNDNVNLNDKENENVYFKNQELNNLFLEYLKNKNYTEVQIKLFIENINNLSRSDLKKIKIVKRTIMKGRKGFFPLPNDEPETTADRVKQTEELVAEQEEEYKMSLKDQLQDFIDS